MREARGRQLCSKMSGCSMASDEGREQHIDGPPRCLGRDDRDGDCIRFMLDREGQESAARSFLRNHQVHVSTGFQQIDKVKFQIIAPMFAQRTPRQVFNPLNAVPVLGAIQAASDRSMSDRFCSHASYSAARPTGIALADRSSASA